MLPANSQHTSPLCFHQRGAFGGSFSVPKGLLDCMIVSIHQNPYNQSDICQNYIELSGTDCNFQLCSPPPSSNNSPPASPQPPLSDPTSGPQTPTPPRESLARGSFYAHYSLGSTPKALGKGSYGSAPRTGPPRADASMRGDGEEEES